MIDDIDADGYQPGVCNIGPAEISRRRQTGYVGIGAAIILGAILLVIDAPRWTRLAVALPVATGLAGFIQARSRFCAGFAMAGLQNMGKVGEQVPVEDAAAREADRRRALRMNAVTMSGGLIAGLVFALLPGGSRD